MNDIPPGWVAIIVSLVGVLAVALPLFRRGKPGINPPAGFVNVGATLEALSGQIGAQATKLEVQDKRISRIERREQAYRSRAAELEHWGRYSTDPVPRTPPAWDPPPDDDEAEG